MKKIISIILLTLVSINSFGKDIELNENLDNKIFVELSLEKNNYIGLIQSNDNNNIVITQIGKENKILVEQSGNSNALIYQNGIGNKIELIQNNKSNAYLSQTGNNNSAIIVQK